VHSNHIARSGLTFRWQPVDDETLLTKYLQWIREDIIWHMGSLKQHVTGTDIILVNNPLVDRDILERLKEDHNFTVPAQLVSGGSEWHDLPTILRSMSKADGGHLYRKLIRSYGICSGKAAEYSMTATLVSVQPLKQAYMRQPLVHQIDIDFVGQQNGFASHYATLIHEDVSTYLSDRCQEPLTVIRVDAKNLKAAKIKSEEPCRIPVLQSVPSPFSTSSSEPSSPSAEVSGLQRDQTEGSDSVSQFVQRSLSSGSKATPGPSIFGQWAFDCSDGEWNSS